MTGISEADVTSHLLNLSEQHGVFSSECGVPHVDDDLIANRGIDSMGAAYLQAMIEEEYSVAIPLAILVTELRSIRSIATYITNCLRVRETSNSRQSWMT